MDARITRILIKCISYCTSYHLRPRIPRYYILDNFPQQNCDVRSSTFGSSLIHLTVGCLVPFFLLLPRSRDSIKWRWSSCVVINYKLISVCFDWRWRWFNQRLVKKTAVLSKSFSNGRVRKLSLDLDDGGSFEGYKVVAAIRCIHVGV